MKNLSLSILSGFFILALVTSPATAAGDAQAGEKVFKKRCKSCHSLDVGKHKMGPSLAAVFGARAASTDFKKYKGLKGFDVEWNEETLDKFLANPKAFVGAKTMAYKLKKDQDRTDVIAYLKSIK